MVKFSAYDDGEVLKRFKWYAFGEGGAFQIKVHSDNNGLPGDEIASITQFGNSNGWNERDLSSSELSLSGDFWVGAKSFSSTQPFGADTTAVSGNSFYLCNNEDENGDCDSNGESEWEQLGFNLMMRVVLDCGDNCPGADPCEDTVPGDTNGDSITNVLDVVTLVQFILGLTDLEGCSVGASDFNGDGIVNVLDVVSLVQDILGVGGRTSDATHAIMNLVDGVSISADGYIGAVQMTLLHDPSFELTLTDKAYVSDYKTDGSETTLIVVMPEGNQIFTTTDDFEVVEVLVTNSDSFINVSELIEFSLSSAYPNPFNPTTTIQFSAPEAGYASVKVYNLMGQVVGVLMDGMVDANTYNLTWNAKELSSGIYTVSYTHLTLPTKRIV